jgi:5-amino-6-(5-phosphoribosylamino)uracil reductase
MRPKIICHMVSSVDGRLLPNRWTPPPAGVDPGITLKVYEMVASQLDAQGWIVGRKTMADMVHGTANPSARNAAPLLRQTYIGQRRERNIAVAIDPHGKLYYGSDGTGSDHFVAVLGKQVTDGYLEQLRYDGVSYLFAGERGDDLQVAMETLGDEFGIEKILLEGGGVLNGAFLKADLIDEMSLLIYPGIDGLAGIPSIFEHHGETDEHPAAGRSLRLMASSTLEGGMVWLHYRVERECSR